MNIVQTYKIGNHITTDSGTFTSEIYKLYSSFKIGGLNIALPERHIVHGHGSLSVTLLSWLTNYATQSVCVTNQYLFWVSSIMKIPKVTPICKASYPFAIYHLLWKYKKWSLFSSALCYCTAELLSSRGRPSSVKAVFSEPVKQCQIWWKGTFSPYLQTTFLFFTILHFWFLRYFFFFSFSLTWDPRPMGDKIQTTSDSPLKVRNRFTPKIMHTSREGFYQSCIKFGSRGH